MTIRFLAPGAPVIDGRLAVVRARRSVAGPASPTTRWDWDDGEHEEAAGDFASGRPARRAHRYAAPGVYRVSLEVHGSHAGTDSGSAAARFVTVRAPDQLGASGWVCDELSGSRVPFGFLVRARGDGETGVTFRCLLDDGEMEATSLRWLMADPPESLHFGGEGRIGAIGGSLRYRVDVRARAADARAGQHLTLTLYPLRGIPGRDSPILRVTGPIRPGRADVAVERPR